MDFLQINKKIKPLCTKSMDDAKRKLDNIAKPVGSLGEFENVIVRLAGIQRTVNVDVQKRCVVVMCADNGVLAQGVAQTPAQITAVMSEVIAKRKSSVCIMAGKTNTDVYPIDIGLLTRVPHEGIADKHISNGTADFTLGPSMTADQAYDAINVGIETAQLLKTRGYRLIATGEMGIGNTTTSSAMASILLNTDVQTVTGRGAGLSDERLLKKIAAIRKAVEINRPDAADAFDVLHKLGGYDIAGMCGLFIGGAMHGMPVVIDGVISSVAALTAARLCPACADYMLASHVSAEPAGRLLLKALGKKPLLHADMRLGEGTGAVAVLPLIDMMLAVYNELLTYSDIGM